MYKINNINLKWYNMVQYGTIPFYEGALRGVSFPLGRALDPRMVFT